MKSGEKFVRLVASVDLEMSDECDNGYMAHTKYREVSRIDCGGAYSVQHREEWGHISGGIC